MATCYEVGCPFSDKESGTCEDKSCIVHPDNFYEERACMHSVCKRKANAPGKA